MQYLFYSSSLVLFYHRERFRLRFTPSGSPLEPVNWAVHDVLFSGLYFCWSDMSHNSERLSWHSHDSYSTSINNVWQWESIPSYPESTSKDKQSHRLPVIQLSSVQISATTPACCSSPTAILGSEYWRSNITLPPQLKSSAAVLDNVMNMSKNPYIGGIRDVVATLVEVLLRHIRVS